MIVTVGNEDGIRVDGSVDGSNIGDILGNWVGF